MAAFVLLAAVAGAFGVAADLSLVRLHRPLLVAESAGAGRGMIAVPVGPSGHLSLIASKLMWDANPVPPSYSPSFFQTTVHGSFPAHPSKPGCAGAGAG